MSKSFKKTQPHIDLNTFLEKAKKIKNFASSSGRRYQVLSIKNDEMTFIRLDAKATEKWKMNLSDVYRAYEEIIDFSTINFKPYVNRRHSPARGLLIDLGMIQ